MGNYFQPQVWGHRVLNPLRDSFAKYQRNQLEQERQVNADERLEMVKEQYKIQKEDKRKDDLSNIFLNRVAETYSVNPWDKRGAYTFNPPSDNKAKLRQHYAP